MAKLKLRAANERPRELLIAASAIGEAAAFAAWLL